MRRERSERIAIAAGALLFGLVFIKNAWVCDDAYIVLRSIEQLFEGNGPRWNPHERVQVFTSPLWFWYVALFRVFVEDAFVLLVSASAAACAAFLYLLSRSFRSGWTFLLAAAALTLSPAFMDFTTAGLENPLCYLAAAIFLKGYSGACGKRPAGKEGYVPHVLLAVSFGAVVMCRYDLILLFAPPFLYASAVCGGNLTARRRAALISASLIPIASWTVFSVIYYGSPLPNPFYAKLGSGIPAGALVSQGWRYIAASIRGEPLTILVIASGMTLPALLRRYRYLPVSAGMLLTIAYVLAAGGDFMRGRFLSHVFLVSAVCIGVLLEDRLFAAGSGAKPRKNRRSAVAAAAAALAAYGILFPGVPASTWKGYTDTGIVDGIADERGFYFRNSSIWRYGSRKSLLFPAHPWSSEGYAYSRPGERAIVVAGSGIGFFGYWAGTRTIIIDPLAVSDPFLARLPADARYERRPGHYRREVPEWYVMALAGRKVDIPESPEGRLYGDVTLAARSDVLFSKKRLRAVLSLLSR